MVESNIHRIRKALSAGSLLFVFVMAVFPIVAAAHASFVRSEPEAGSVLKTPPSAITIWFAEPVDARFSSISVLDVDGTKMNTGGVTGLPGDPNALIAMLPRLPDGQYTIAWKNISALDGHSYTGSFSLTIGVAVRSSGGVVPASISAPIIMNPAEPILRWLMVLSLLAVFGGLAFEGTVWGPLLAAAGRDSVPASTCDQVTLRTRAMLWSAVGLFAIASVGLLMVQTASATGSSVLSTVGKPVWDFALHTRWGQMWLLRAVFVVGLALVLWRRGVRQKKLKSSGQSALVLETGWLSLGVLLSAGTLMATSYVSHAGGAMGIEWPALINDLLHLVAAGVWVGGLFHFAIECGPLNRELADGRKTSLLAIVVPRFSTVAIMSVATLVVTGLFNSWVEVGRFQALATPYGSVLLAKVALFVGLLSLGAINLLRLSPQLASSKSAGWKLTRSVRVEATLGIIVLLATGFLASMQPARQAFRESHALSLKQMVENAQVNLTVDPGQPGSNRLVASIKDRDGKPIPDTSQVTVTLISDNSAIGSMDAVDMVRGQGSEYVLNNAPLTVAGKWQATLIISRSDAVDVRATFELDITNASPAAGSSTPSSRTAWLFVLGEVVSLGLVFRVVSLVKGRARIRQWHV